MTPKDKQEEIETLEQMIEAECLVIGCMEKEGETDIDRRPLKALIAGLEALKNLNREKGDRTKGERKKRDTTLP